MNRKLKNLGLALFAAFALSAIGASAASADIFTSSATGGSTVLTSVSSTGLALHAFGAPIICEVNNLSGTQSGSAATEITFTPTYDECGWVGLPMEVRLNHCDYTFTTKTNGGHAPLHIECGDGEHIEQEIRSFGHCNFTIGSQTTAGGVTYTNLKDGTVTVDITASVQMHRDPGSFICNTMSTEATGEFTGSIILAGYEDEGTPTTENETVTWTGDETATTEGVGSTHWNWTLKEGSQVDIEVETT